MLVRPPLSPFNSSSGCVSEERRISDSPRSVTAMAKVSGRKLFVSSKLGKMDLYLTQWSLLRDLHGYIRIESLCGNFEPVILSGISLNSTVCEDIRRSISQASLDVFASCGVLRRGPQFSPTVLGPRGFISFLVGWCLHVNTRCAKTCTSSETAKAQYLELQMPKYKALLQCEPVRLGVYADSLKSELIAVIPLGLRGNRSRSSVGAADDHTTEIPSDIIMVEGHALRFRCKEEATFWKVAIEDCITCSLERWEELFGSPHDSGRIPRGYRGQYERLSSVIAGLSDQTDFPPDEDILGKCLTCIEYLSQRVAGCRCQKSIELGKEDLLLETRDLLRAKLKSNSPFP